MGSMRRWNSGPRSRREELVRGAYKHDGKADGGEELETGFDDPWLLSLGRETRERELEKRLDSCGGVAIKIKSEE